MDGFSKSDEASATFGPWEGKGGGREGEGRGTTYSILPQVTQQPTDTCSHDGITQKARTTLRTTERESKLT